MDLKNKKCVPCEGGVPKLTPERVQEYLQQVAGWKSEGEKIHKTFKFKNFSEAVKFINRMAELAESEGHHPDFAVHYNIVEVTLWTHAIGGLSENDFILATKINEFEK